MHSILIQLKKIVTRVLCPFLFFFASYQLSGQCSIVSSCGYTVNVAVRTLSIIPSSTICTAGPGYNYNVRFAYTVTAVGSNSCSGGTLGVQPQIFCNSGQNNGYYTINTAIPSGAVSVSNSGTLVTTTNPYRNVADCNSVTPTSLGCNSMQITIFGPGIPTATYPCSFSTLPVELNEFSASYGEGGILLKWLTKSEVNNDFFGLERSTDGENWGTIYTVKGRGTTKLTVSYSYKDQQASKGINYYRLKQTDFDGKYTYSSIIFANLGPQPGNYRFFPNPAKEAIFVESNQSKPEKASIISPEGILLREVDLENNKGISLTGLPQGLLILFIPGGTNTHYYKIIHE